MHLTHSVPSRDVVSKPISKINSDLDPVDATDDRVWGR